MKTLATTPLSLLDLVIYPQGKTIADGFRATKELAQLAERTGYKRYWIAEHHNIVGVASAATAVLIGYVGENTSTIRIGSGGIMLPNHAPLIVAEQFGTLATLYPGRVDLGLGRAPGSDQLTHRAIRGGLPERDFADLIQELFYFLSPAESGQKLKAVPGAGAELDIWILGSSLYSAQLAGALGLPYAFASHFAPGLLYQALALYREQFRPSATLKSPYVMVGAPVVAADTDERADFLATTIYQRFLGMVRGRRTGSAEPVESMAGIWTREEEAAVMSMLKMIVVGGPEKTARGLQEIIDSTQADELILTSDLFDYADRLRSVTIIAEGARGHANRS